MSNGSDTREVVLWAVSGRSALEYIPVGNKELADSGLDGLPAGSREPADSGRDGPSNAPAEAGLGGSSSGSHRYEFGIPGTDEGSGGNSSQADLSHFP